MGRIIIGADFVPTQSNEKLFEQKELETLFGNEILSIINNAEYRIFNLETPLTDRPAPIPKSGPALCAAIQTINTYQALRVDLVTLANNHCMDQGASGLSDTMKTLNDNHIHYVGAGDSIIDARKPFYITCHNNKRIGIYACAEHEFSIADSITPGANPFDPLETLDQINQLSKETDYVIVLFHGGKELYRYPSPLLQKTCRKIIEKGANLIITQHSHCIGCQEKYLHGTIVYGQGNFLFDLSDSVFWKTGLLVSVDTDSFQLEYIPIVKQKNTVRLADAEAKTEILEAFQKRSNEIMDSSFVSGQYNKLAESYFYNYACLLSGINDSSFLYRVLNKISSYQYGKYLIRKRYNKSKCFRIMNIIRCEAHNECLLQGLKLFSDKEKF